MLRERKANAAITLVVLSAVVWIAMVGVLSVRVMRALDAKYEHTHTAECWDD